MITTLLQLVWSYLKIGFFGFGGGYAMLSLIHSEVVVRNEWLTNGEFSDIIAISQMTPGPIALNSATYIGYEVAGVLGSVVATVAVCVPALTLMMLLTRLTPANSMKNWKASPRYRLLVRLPVRLRVQSVLSVARSPRNRP